MPEQLTELAAIPPLLRVFCNREEQDAGHADIRALDNRRRLAERTTEQHAGGTIAQRIHAGGYLTTAARL